MLLHGVDVGGGFVELTHELPGLDRRVAAVAARLGVPRELGAYDALYWPGLGPAVYRIPPPRRRDLAAAITEAAVESTWYHPYGYGTVTAVVEAPMWGVAAVANGAPHPDPDAELRSVSRTLRRDTGLLGGLAARIRPYVAGVPDADRLLAPVDDYLLVCPGLADAWDPDCGNDSAHPLPPMTTARLAALRLAAAPRPAHCGAAAPARHPRGPRSHRRAAGVEPADRRALRGPPGHARRPLDPRGPPGGVPGPGDPRRVRPGRTGDTRGIPFG